MVFVQNERKNNGYQIALYEMVNGRYKLDEGTKRTAGTIRDIGVLVTGLAEHLEKQGDREKLVMGTENEDVADTYENVVLVK